MIRQQQFLLASLLAAGLCMVPACSKGSKQLPQDEQASPKTVQPDTKAEAAERQRKADAEAKATREAEDRRRKEEANAEAQARAIAKAEDDARAKTKAEADARIKQEEEAKAKAALIADLKAKLGDAENAEAAVKKETQPLRDKAKTYSDVAAQCRTKAERAIALSKNIAEVSRGKPLTREQTIALTQYEQVRRQAEADAAAADQLARELNRKADQTERQTKQETADLRAKFQQVEQAPSGPSGAGEDQATIAARQAYETARHRELTVIGLKDGASGVPERIDAKVMQVIDQGQMLVGIDDARTNNGLYATWIMVKCPTKGIVDGKFWRGGQWKEVTGSEVLIVSGTTTYKTVTGGTKTVFVLAPMFPPTETATNQSPAPSETPAPPPADEIAVKVKKVAGIDLVAVPKGQFYMGSPASDNYADASERPQHKVTISRPFYLGRYDVTVGQFRRFADASGYQTEAEKARDQRTWRKPGFDQTDAYPVVCVSWNDAVAFCGWLAKETGANVRLPREAEWEFACRAGTTTRFYFGDSEADLGDYGWYKKNANRLQPCGQKKPNGIGLYDMHGLVWQWCADGKRTYRAKDETDPEGPTTAGTPRVIRGGTAFYEARQCRAASRDAAEPDGRNDHFGFRVLVSH